MEPFFTAYNARFASMPAAAGDKAGSPQWYSWESGPVHMIQLNTYASYAVGSDQYKWLVADLASIDRAKTPWVLVQLHAPWYNSNTVHTNDGQPMRVALESLIVQAKVAQVYAGHVHAYERSVPSINLQPAAGGPVYVTVGDGGNREGLASKWVEPCPAWSVYRQATYGFGVLEASNATHLRWVWHQNEDLSPGLVDEVFFVKGEQVPGAGECTTAAPRMADGSAPRFAQ